MEVVERATDVSPVPPTPVGAAAPLTPPAPPLAGAVTSAPVTSAVTPEAPAPSYLKEMQRQIERVSEENKSLRRMLDDTRAQVQTTRREAERFGRRTEVALASASWGAGRLRGLENKQASREAIVS
eukprot:9219803-Alexandrium_andersonii.AAC.1